MSGSEFHREHGCFQTMLVEGAGMVEYRAFTVGRDGHFVGSEALICADDLEAIEKAKRFVDGHDIELWSGDRFVIRLIHNPK
jgi:hypothetical protein